MVTRISQFQADSGIKSGDFVIDDSGIRSENFVIDDSGNLSSLKFAVGDIVTITEFSSDGTFAGNSNSAVPTEQATKTYADTKISKAGVAAINPATGLVDPNFGIMTGPLILSRDPQPADDELYDGLIAATKRYVDAAADTGNITFVDNSITSEDSSSISFTPSVVFNSDVTVENDFVVGNLRITQNGLHINSLADVDTESTPPTPGQVLKWNGSKWAPAADIAEGGAGLDADTLDGFNSDYFLNYNNLSNTPDLTDPSFTSATITTANITTANITGLATLQQLSEILNTKTNATGTVVHDFSTGSIWYHSSISANFTANFTNVPTTNNRTLSVTLILNQGATGRYPNAVQINSSSVTINWVGNITPAPSSSRFDIVSFLLIRTGSTWYVLGSLTPY